MATPISATTNAPAIKPSQPEPLLRLSAIVPSSVMFRGELGGAALGSTRLARRGDRIADEVDGAALFYVPHAGREQRHQRRGEAKRSRLRGTALRQRLRFALPARQSAWPRAAARR